MQRSVAQISSFFLDPVHRNKRVRKGTASSPGKTLFSVSPSTLKHIVQVPKISTVSTDQSQASQVYSFLAVLSSTEKGGQRMTLPFISKQNPRINITRLWTESPATALTPTPHPTLAPPQSLLDPATHSSDHLFFQSPAFPMKTPPLEPKCPSLLASWQWQKSLNTAYYTTCSSLTGKMEMTPEGQTQTWILLTTTSPTPDCGVFQKLGCIMMALFKPPYCSDSTGIFFLSCLGNTILYQAAWAFDSYNLSYKKSPVIFQES